EMESEGLASNLRAVAEAEAMANRSATSVLIRAGSLTAKEIPAERAPRHGVCGRHGGTERRLTWGDLVASSTMVFMPPGLGPKSRRGRRGDKAESETPGRRAARGQGPHSSEEPRREPRDRRPRAPGRAGAERSRRGAKGGHRTGAQRGGSE